MTDSSNKRGTPDATARHRGRGHSGVSQNSQAAVTFASCSNQPPTLINANCRVILATAHFVRNDGLQLEAPLRGSIS
jgi:hypothetical protein